MVRWLLELIATVFIAYVVLIYIIVIAYIFGFDSQKFAIAAILFWILAPTGKRFAAWMMEKMITNPNRLDDKSDATG